MNMFDDISDNKKDLPKIKSIEKEVGKYQFNGYQKLGNLFPACSSTATLFSDVCVTTEFNFFLMILFWFVSFIFCLFFFGLGHIIALLTSINDKMK